MFTIVQLIGLYIVTIVLGKRARRPTPTTFAFVALITLVQACVVLIHMLTKEIPTA